MRLTFTTAALAGSLLCAAAAAQDVESIPFEGGAITITEKEDGLKELAYDGRVVTTNYMVLFDRIVEVGGVQVALVNVGEGGNACAPSTVILWRGGTEVRDELVGDDCGAPSPAVSDYAIFFVPYLLPGETGTVQQWTPEERLVDFGTLSYTPQRGSTWAGIDPATTTHPLDLFRNADFHAAAQKLLGDDITDYAAGLGTAAAPEQVDGLLTGRGCVPHACGISDSFFALDLANRALYLAQQQGEGTPKTWPALDAWPEAARKAMKEALER